MIQLWRLSISGHIARMDDDADAKKVEGLEKRLGLGLARSRSRLVSVSWNCRKVLVSVSSRTRNRMSRSRKLRSNGSLTRELEETTRASPYHVAEHRPARSESLQPHTEQSSRPGSEPSSVEADVYLQHCTVLVVHTRKEEEIFESHWW